MITEPAPGKDSYIGIALFMFETAMVKDAVWRE